MPNDAPACAALRRDGTPCMSRVLVDGRHCFAHAPDLDSVRSEARRRGGANRANATRLRGLMPPRLIPIFDRLERALTEVHTGELDPRVASAMAALSRAMVAVLTSGEVEQRVRNLEAAQKEAERRGA